MNIPAHLLPSDGRFGSGPSRPRIGQATRVLHEYSQTLGTSHRRRPVKRIVEKIREDLSTLFALPEGYEVILGNGGASLVWDALAFTGVEKHAQAAVYGAFSAKAAAAIDRAPWLSCEQIVAEPGEVSICKEEGDVDSYLYAHNETSSAAMAPVRRFGSSPQALTYVDGTSSAGGVSVDIAQTDLYYFSPQKCFGAEGGLWLALASPAALERFERLSRARWVPEILDLHIACKNSKANQTFNTPSLINLMLIADQVEWMLAQGGLEEMDRRTRRASQVIYSWAENSSFASPFVSPQFRSCLGVTVDICDEIDAQKIRDHLRENGIVDIEPYRSLGRNQLRIATFPNISDDDARALTACIDYVVEKLLTQGVAGS